MITFLKKKVSFYYYAALKSPAIIAITAPMPVTIAMPSAILVEVATLVCTSVSTSGRGVIVLVNS